MSMALAFDTLRAAKQLQQSGFEKTQAEAIVSIVSIVQGRHLATASDSIYIVSACPHGLNARLSSYL